MVIEAVLPCTMSGNQPRQTLHKPSPFAVNIRNHQSPHTAEPAETWDPGVYCSSLFQSVSIA